MIRDALALGALSAGFSFLGAAAMRRYSGRLGFTDEPNERSLHSIPTPRAGGIGFAIAVPLLTALGLTRVNGAIAPPEAALLAAAVLLALVGLADDRWRLPAGVRLAAQVAAAVAVMAAGGTIQRLAAPGLFDIDLGSWAGPITFVWLVALTNIYNFMDGIDGLAAVQAIVAAAALAVVSSCLGHDDLALGYLILCAGAAGFLILNRPPARVFMGDVGSTFLGFTLAGWAALGTVRSPSVPVLASIAVLSPFLFDSLITLLRRVLRGERVSQAHRSHMYQRLVARGWTHGRTTALYGALAAIAGVLVIATWCFARTSAVFLLAALAVPIVIPVILKRRGS